LTTKPDLSVKGTIFALLGLN